jgi:hypothetical protein
MKEFEPKKNSHSSENVNHGLLRNNYFSKENVVKRERDSKKKKTQRKSNLFENENINQEKEGSDHSNSVIIPPNNFENFENKIEFKQNPP